MANAADRKSVREAERSARQVEKARGEVLIGLMSTAAGRAWVWEKLESASVFASTYNDNPQRMAYTEGIRASGIALLTDVMQWCPDHFILAMREANARRSESDNAPDARSDDASEPAGSTEPGRVDQGPPEPVVDEATGEVRYP